MESPLLQRLPSSSVPSANIPDSPTTSNPSKLPKRSNPKHRDAVLKRIHNEGNFLKRCASPSADSLRGTITSPPLDDRRVMSPPLEVLSSDPGQQVMFLGNSTGGVCCEQCNNCLIDLKRQALKWTFPDNVINTAASKDPDFFKKLEEKLHVPVSHKKFLHRDCCEFCETSVKQLRKEAITMVQSIEQAQSISPQTNISQLVGSCKIVPYQTPPSAHKRYPGNRVGYPCPQTPLAAQAQAYLDQNVRAWMSPKNSSINPGRNQDTSMNSDFHQPSAYAPYTPGTYPNAKLGYPPTYPHPMAATHAQGVQYIPVEAYHQYHQMQHIDGAYEGVMYPGPHPNIMYQSPQPSSPLHQSQTPSPAASFFARAAQKLHMSSKKRRRHQATPELPVFPTRFSQIVKVTPPPAPPCLLRSVGRAGNPTSSKVRVMLRISPHVSHTSHSDGSAQFLSVDPRKKQVTVYDPSHCGYATRSSAHSKAGTPAPKMFAFDNVFAADDSLAEVCSSGLTDVIQAVVNGADGCLFSYGHAKSGKYETVIGRDDSVQTLGIVPCAISWLFRLINEQKEKTGARFSVRVSAVEITGNQEQLKDLLSDVAQSTESGVGTSPGVYLREDPISGTQLENQSELRAPTADMAAYYLDAALAARTVTDEEESRTSHLLFTFHVYQYRVEKPNRAGLPAVAGGRSRLHVIHLGNCSRSKDPNISTTTAGLSLSALGSVILALLNGQRHLPHRDSKVTQLLRDSLGNLTCSICMIAHVSSAISHYNETLQVIQLAARIHRMRRRRNKFSSASSEDSSEDSYRLRRFGRGFRGGTMGTLREDVPATASSDPDCTSSSEQSCDTVIYLGYRGISLSDQATDNESPPVNVPVMPRTNPRISSKSPRRNGTRSSGDEGSYSDSRMSLSRGPNRYFTSSSSLNRIPVRSGSLDNYMQSPSSSPHLSQLKSHHSSPKTPALQRCYSDSEDSQFKKPDKAPFMPKTNGNISYRDRMDNEFLNEEKWVDGPGVYANSPVKPGETWVDGPKCVSNAKQDTKKNVDPKKNAYCKIAPDEKWIDGPSEMIVKPTTKIAQISKVHKSDLKSGSDTLKSTNSGKQKANKLDERPISTTSIDSKSSLTVEVGMDNSTHLTEQANIDDDCMNPFVRDWVVKHSAVSSEATITKGLSHSAKLQTEKQSQKHAHRLATQSSPKYSPINHRKLKPGVEIQKIGLPPSSSPTLRVAEWVKSVTTNSPTTMQSNSVFSSENKHARSSHNQSQDDSTMSVVSSKTNQTTEHNKSFSGVDDMDTTPSMNMMDYSCSVSTESASDMSAYDNANPFCTNRESVYEMQFDEQISKNLPSDIADDETFSTHSHCTKDTDHMEDQETDYLAKVSAALDDMTEQADKIDLCDVNTMKEPSVSNIVVPKYLTDSRLRCPDGASNPNIICEFESGKIQQNAISSHDIIVEQKILGSLPLGEKNRIIDGQSERDSAIEALRAEMKSDKFISKNKSKVNKSKPPVPQKVNNSEKSSGLPKFLSKSSSKLKDDKVLSKPPSNIPSVNHTSRSKEKEIKTSSCSSLRSSSQPSFSSPSSISTRSSKDSSQSPSHSRLPIFSSKSSKDKLSKNYKSSSLSRKDKDKSVSFNVYNCQIGDVGHRATDSDSGNDSGIVANEHRKLLSPYATVGKARTPSHSSGHGSDNSSIISADVVAKTIHQTEVGAGASSGYESMMRDSEATGTSSSNHDDTASESSNGEKQKNDSKKNKSGKRSRSVPARGEDDGYSKHTSSKDGPSSKAWVDIRTIEKYRDEPMELQSYEMDDINRMQHQRRRIDSVEQETLLEKEKLKELLGDQFDLADETTAMKDDGSTDRGAWAFDCKSLLCFSCRSNNSETSTT